MKKNVRKVFFKYQLTLSGEYFLDYLKKKQAGLIDETNINVYYEEHLDDICVKVGEGLNKLGYEITDQDKRTITGIVIRELESIRKEGK